MTPLVTGNLEFPDENQTSYSVPAAGPSRSQLAQPQQPERVTQQCTFASYPGVNPYLSSQETPHSISSGLLPGWQHPSFPQILAPATISPGSPADPRSQQLHFPQQFYPLPSGYQYPAGPQNSSYHGALQDNTPFFVNDASAAPTKRKQSSNTSGSTTRKRRRQIVVPAGPPSVAAICGVGPSDSDLTSHSDPPSTTSLLDSQQSESNDRTETTLSDLPTVPPETAYAPRKKRSSAANATDCWYFVRALKEIQEPKVWPTHEPSLFEKPSTPYIGCKLCT